VPASPSLVLDNPADQNGGNFGSSVAAGGDVNSDGVGDLVIGAERQDSGATDEGVVFVYHGVAGGLPGSPTTTLDNPANQADAYFGSSVAMAGDVDGDGFADVLVGALYFAAPEDNEGNVFVYRGSVAGVSVPPWIALDNPTDQVAGQFGAAVGAAGDVNGDGLADFIVGANQQSAGAAFEGNAFVWYGSTSGLASTPDVVLDNPDNEASSYFGCSVGGGGDVNADSFTDVVIGAFAIDEGALDEGNAFVFMGSASGLAAAPSVRLDNSSNQVNGLFGFATAGVGDLNGDGFADVASGAIGQEIGGCALNNDCGAAYAFHGSAGGIPLSPTTSIPGAGGTYATFGRSVGP
jgi:hypothetical protein